MTDKLTDNKKQYGEGNKLADKNYTDSVKQYLQTQDVDSAANRAKKALEREDQKAELEKAERKAASRSKADHESTH